MSHRSFLDRWREEPWKQTGEAIGHVVVACASISIFAGFAVWGFPGWQIVGGAAAMVPWVVLRELIDQQPIEDWLDTLADSLEFMSGGSLGGLVFMLIV